MKISDSLKELIPDENPLDGLQLRAALQNHPQISFSVFEDCVDVSLLQKRALSQFVCVTPSKFW